MTRLAAIIALTLFAPPAFSQVQDGSNGEGTLFLTVYDPGRGQTYNVDLGVTISEFLIDPGAVSDFNGIRVPADLTNWMLASPDSSAILWDVAALNFAAPQDLTGPFGVLITAAGPPSAPTSFVAYDPIAATMRSYIDGVNASIANTGSITTGGAGYFADPVTWNRNVGNALVGTTGAPINTRTSIYAVIADLGTDPDANTYSVSELTQLRLHLVPIPTPAILLLSALAGFAGLTWRRRSTA